MTLDPTTLAPYAGAAAAAGSLAALLALHRLRPQQRTRPVATLLFYERAVSASSMSVLGGPLSRRWTLLLLAGICGLLAAAVAFAPRHGRRSGRPAAVVVDAGCELQAVSPSSGWDRVRSAAQAALARMPGEDGPAVLLAGAQPTVLAAAGTPAAVAADRMARRSPDTRPGRPAAALLLANDLDAAGEIDWFTTAAAVPPDVPPAVAARVVRRSLPSSLATALTSILFEPSPGEAARGRLLVRVGGNLSTGLLVAAKSDAGRRLGPSPPSAAGEVDFGDVPTDGSTWTINLLNAPGATAEHAGRVVVPRRLPPRFVFDDGTPAPLRAALVATFGDGPTVGTCPVRVAASGTPGGGFAVVADARTAAPRRPLTWAASAEPLADVSIVGCSGLSTAAAPLLRAGGDTVAAFVPAPNGQECGTVLLSAALFDADRCDLTRRAAFPLIIRRACERLGFLTLGSPTVTAGRLDQDPLWPGAVGRSPAVVYETPGAAGVAEPPASPRSSWACSPSQVLLLAALGMLTAEGVLFARRQVV